MLDQAPDQRKGAVGAKPQPRMMIQPKMLARIGRPRLMMIGAVRGLCTKKDIFRHRCGNR